MDLDCVPATAAGFWILENCPIPHFKVDRTLGIEAGTLLKAGSDEPKCWWASLEKIAENDYNLAAGRYKPQVVEPVPDDDPAELIQEVLGIEKGIMSGLEKLLQ